MNSNTYRQLDDEGVIELLKHRGDIIVIDESIPNGIVRRTEELDVAALKRAELARHEPKTRSGYTKPKMARRDVAKAKAARAARKRNRK